jgi:hypothetical protein
MMKKALLGAMAATLLATSGVQAQDEMMMGTRPPPFTVGVYGGLAWSSPWATLGSVGGSRPIRDTQSISPGLAPMFGGVAHFTLMNLGLRLHYGYMPAAIRGTENQWRFPDNYPLNNHFYDLSLVFHPFTARGRNFLGTSYMFLGGGGLTADYADGANTCPSGGRLRGIDQRGIELRCNGRASTVGQVTAGLGGDIFTLLGLGFFLEGAVHGYDSPMRDFAPQPATVQGANDRFAFTPNIKLGLKFGFGARAPEVLPPPPPPPMDPLPPVEAPAEQAIRVCILEGGQLREVDAMVNPATGDTMAVVAGERRRFAEAYPATTGYAGGADFFVQDRPITFRNRRYVRFGLTRIIPATDVQRVADFQGTTVFAETGANMQNPDVLYVLVRPGCEFQPYQRETVTRVRG